jgi:hypothetical protein
MILCLTITQIFSVVKENAKMGEKRKLTARGYPQAFSLSGEDVKILRALAEKWKMSRSAVVRALLQREAGRLLAEAEREGSDERENK